MKKAQLVAIVEYIKGYMPKHSLAQSKKGVTMGLVINVVLGLFILGFIIFALIYAGTKINATLSDATENASKDVIRNLTAAIGTIPPLFSIVGIVAMLTLIMGLLFLIVRTVQGGVGGGGV